MDQIAYVNGSFVPMADAKVSILDRGFLFADGIYEVAAVLDGKLIDNASHLARLERSVGEIALALPETLERIQEIQKELIARKNSCQRFYRIRNEQRASSLFVIASQRVARMRAR